jgi:hypothetical protein
MVSVAVRMEGADQLRRDLRMFAPDLGKELQRELSSAAQSVASTARGLLPDGAPLSGWARAWDGDRLRWDSARARAGIKPSTARGRSTPAGTVAVITINQTDPAGSVFEVGGRRGGGAMTTRIGWRYGPASRGAWRAAESRRRDITARVEDAVNRIAAELGRRIAAGTGGR